MSDLFGAINPLHSALDYHLERHTVLASNIAHVDTPGYKPSDLARVEQAGFGSVLGVALAKTDGAHLQGPDASVASLDGRIFEDLSAGAGNDGNYVSLDREAAKVAANQLRYDTVSAIVSAELRQLQYAAGDAKT
ncbi:MAG TPA: flagellar basal body rod protein FlgB [Polyangiaceae bacterium]